MEEKTKPFRVDDDHRTNYLSLTPGGDEVFVHFGNEVRVYDKVKNPKSYANFIIRRIEKGEGEIPTKIEIKGEVLWEK